MPTTDIESIEIEKEAITNARNRLNSTVEYGSKNQENAILTHALKKHINFDFETEKANFLIDKEATFQEFKKEEKNALIEAHAYKQSYTKRSWELLKAYLTPYLIEYENALKWNEKIGNRTVESLVKEALHNGFTDKLALENEQKYIAEIVEKYHGYTFKLETEKREIIILKRL